MRMSLASPSAVAVALLLSLPFAADAAEKAPEFSLKKMDGGRMTLAENLGNGPVLINFWASWCKPCKYEAPHLIELYENYGKRGFRVVAISLDKVASLSKVKSTARKLGLPYPVVLDPTSEYARKLQVSVLPTSILLDTEGRIVRTFTGYRPGDEKEIAREVEKLLPAEGAEAT